MRVTSYPLSYHALIRSCSETLRLACKCIDPNQTVLINLNKRQRLIRSYSETFRVIHKCKTSNQKLLDISKQTTT